MLILCMVLPIMGLQASPPPLALYGNLPGFEMAALSASGRYLSIIGVVGDQRRLIVLDKDVKPVLDAPLGDVKVRAIRWAGDARLLVQTSATVALNMDFTAAKAELSNILVISIPDGRSFTVFDGNGNITGGVSGYHGALERDGRWYGYFGGISVEVKPDSGALRPDLYEVDLETGRARRIAKRHEADVSREWLIDGQGGIAATLDFAPKEGDWSLRNAAGKVIARGRAPQGDIDLVGLGQAPGTVIYGQGDIETGASRWMELPLAGGMPVEIFPDESVLGSFMDRTTRRLIGHRRDADVPQAVFYDGERQKTVERIARAFRGHGVVIVDWSDSFDRLLVRTEGSVDPGSWYVVNVKTHAADPIGRSYPIAEADIGPVRTISYKAADGLDMSGVLTLPPGRPVKNLPVVVLPHGGPAARDYPEFYWWAQAFASRGYAVFQPNFRGSTGFGSAFQKAGEGQWGRKMQTDISDGLAALVRDGVVDPRRACIMGASYGGYAALAGVTLQQGLYRCAVSVAGVSDLTRLYIQEKSESLDNRTLIRSLKAELGSGGDLKLVSPTRFAARADAPVLLILGKDDIVVPYVQSRLMADALADAKKPFELVTLKGEDHWLSRGSTRQQMLAAALAFVERYNPPDPQP